MDQTTSARSPGAGGAAPESAASGGQAELERAIAAMIENVDRLDGLDLEATEPATTFGWDRG